MCGNGSCAVIGRGALQAACRRLSGPRRRGPLPLAPPKAAPRPPNRINRRFAASQPPAHEKSKTISKNSRALYPGRGYRREAKKYPRPAFPGEGAFEAVYVLQQRQIPKKYHRIGEHEQGAVEPVQQTPMAGKQAAVVLDPHPALDLRKN